MADKFKISCETDFCTPTCDNVFDLVHVSYLIRGGTRVMWDLVPTFEDEKPWEFQLQVGESGNPNAHDWENVGLPVEDGCYAIDASKHEYGKSPNTHYRIKLTTPNGVYYSEPTAKMGVLAPRDWRLAREIVRRELVRFKYSAQDGYLLKRIISGKTCTRCLDFQTNEVKDPYCPNCYGTGKECGYYYPMGCIWADVSPVTKKMHVDDQGARGTVQDITVSGRMLMLPLINEYDVWVSRKTDDRYYILSIQNAAEIRGVPLIANVEMKPAPYTDVIYDIPIPQQDDYLEPVGDECLDKNADPSLITINPTGLEFIQAIDKDLISEIPYQYLKSEAVMEEVRMSLLKLNQLMRMSKEKGDKDTEENLTGLKEKLEASLNIMNGLDK